MGVSILRPKSTFCLALSLIATTKRELILVDREKRNEIREGAKNIHLVYAAKFGEVMDDQFITHIDWKWERWQIVRAASAFPKDWFEKNNFLHQIDLWVDGTCLYNHHPTKVGMLNFVALI